MCGLPLQGCAGPLEEVRVLRLVAMLSQRKAALQDPVVNRSAARHTLHLALETAERVSLDWQLYFLLELVKLAWEENNHQLALKHVAQAKLIASNAQQPHFLALFILVEAYLSLARRDVSNAIQHLQVYKQIQETHVHQTTNTTWISLRVMYDILSLEHSFVVGDTQHAKSHAKNICAYVQTMNTTGLVKSFFKWCDGRVLGALYYYASGAVERVSAPLRAIPMLAEGRKRVFNLLEKERLICLVERNGQQVLELLNTKEKEALALVRLNFCLLEQLFLAYITSSEYTYASQVLWDMLDMSMKWGYYHRDFASIIHMLAGHLSMICLPDKAAPHYILANQIMQHEQDLSGAVVADLFACIAFLQASSFKKVEEGLRKCWNRIESSPPLIHAFGLYVRALVHLHSSQSAQARTMLIDSLKLRLDNPQMTAQIYNAIAESILQDSKIETARKSLQEAFKLGSALQDLPSLLTTLRLHNHVCANAASGREDPAVAIEQREIAGQMKAFTDNYKARLLDALNLRQTALITLLLQPETEEAC